MFYVLHKNFKILMRLHHQFLILFFSTFRIYFTFSWTFLSSAEHAIFHKKNKKADSLVTPCVHLTMRFSLLVLGLYKKGF